jgi:TRAP-type C4-dicarboxylate transport system substrate-binding protein
MIDLVESTPLEYVALQWHSTGLKYVTQDAHGMLVGAWIMNKSVFDSLPAEIRDTMVTMARRNSQRESGRTRQADQGALKRLIDRKYTSTPYTAAGKAAWAQIYSDVRTRMVNRVYSAALLARVMELAKTP